MSCSSLEELGGARTFPENTVYRLGGCAARLFSASITTIAQSHRRHSRSTPYRKREARERLYHYHLYHSILSPASYTYRLFIRKSWAVIGMS